MCFLFVVILVVLFCFIGVVLVGVDDEFDLIFKKLIVWKFLILDYKLVMYVVDDFLVEGVVCYFIVLEKGGVLGWLGVVEEVLDIFLVCW